MTPHESVFDDGNVELSRFGGLRLRTQLTVDSGPVCLRHVAMPIDGHDNQFMMMFWEHFDGDPRRLELFYFLPPELLR